MRLRVKRQLPPGVVVPHNDRRPTPAEARFLSELPGPTAGRRSLSMREALVRCHALDVPVCRAAVTMGIHIATLRAMERHGLLLVVSRRDNRSRPVTLWKPTERGLEILVADEPGSLRLRVEHVEVGVGESKRDVLIEEPEPIDDLSQRRITEQANATDRARRAGVVEATLDDRRTLERRLRGLRQLAVSGGVDVRSEMRMVERMLDAMERKIRQQAQARRAA